MYIQLEKGCAVLPLDALPHPSVWAPRIGCGRPQYSVAAMMEAPVSLDLTANLHTKILDFRGSDSSITSLSVMAGILMSIGNFPEVLSRLRKRSRLRQGRRFQCVHAATCRHD